MKKIIFIITICILSSCAEQYTCPTYMDNKKITKTDLNCNIKQQSIDLH